MKYFCRDKKPINYELWWAYMLDPVYVFVDRHVYGTTDVCTSWIGMQTEYDSKPILWCSIVRRWDGSCPIVNMAVWSDWDTTLEGVKALHINLAKEIGIPFGETRKHPIKKGR